MSDQIVTYRDLADELDTVADRFENLRIAYAQLRTQFVVITRMAERDGHDQIALLAGLGETAANGGEERAKEGHDSARDKVAHAWAMTPKREWRKAGFPCEPDAAELAQEQAFAILVTGFPKDGFDGDAKLRCVIEKEGV